MCLLGQTRSVIPICRNLFFLTSRMTPACSMTSMEYFQTLTHITRTCWPMFREKLVHVWSLGLQTGARCVNHHRMCPWIHLGLPRIGGPPCQDWSSAGNKQGLNGPQLPTLISMGRKSTACYDAVCIVENSPNMPDWVPQSCWPTWFSWVSAIVDPSDVGYDFLARIFY